MKIAGSWFQNPDTQAVLRCITDAGYHAFLVGGCIRNALIGAPVADIDISTEARPETVSKLAKEAGFKVIPTGIDHGTVTVIAGGEPHEITTFRRDEETDGRRAVIAFSDRVEEDAERRDFTMNALYADPDGEILDPIGGLGDLQARHVRFIGHAQDRIREDYLRILRFFRFTAWYGDPELGFDADALAAISENLAGLESLSRERIGHEMQKLLAAPEPAPAVATMAQSGVLGVLLPGSDARVLPVFVHLEAQAGLESHWVSRLAALGGQDVANLLRLSKQAARNLDSLSRAANEFERPAVHGYRLGQELGSRSWLLRLAKLETELSASDLEKVAFGAEQVFPVKAADLLDQLQGAALGAELKRLEAIWIESNFSLSKSDLLGSA